MTRARRWRILDTAMGHSAADRSELLAQEALREGMSRLPSGVVVVTNWIDRKPWGTTVSSCSSLSLSPPLVVVGLISTATSTRAILEQQSFGVNILRDTQAEIAARSAAPGRPKFIEDLVADDHDMGSPALRGALASIHCELYNALGVGDHMLLIGEVRAVELGVAGEPLLYHRRLFRRLDPVREQS
jgi:flavin reductase (DIM6/NTAB) family NADH-FMN oxidoreductase RutF